MLTDIIREQTLAIIAMLAAQGYDLPARATGWADAYLGRLAEQGAALEIQEILRSGGKTLPLAACLSVSMVLSRVPATYQESFGSSERRRHIQREFEDAALLFDGIAKTFGTKEASVWPAGDSLPSPENMASHLRMYVMVMGALPVLFELIEVRSMKDIERYVLTAYIKHATGGWHDREVSALLSIVTGNELDEGTHRGWRNRSFDELNLPLLQMVWQVAEICAEHHYNAQTNSGLRVT